MNLPNLITIARIPALFLLVGMIYGGAHPTLVFALYVIMALSDFVDGYLARRFGQTSDFGALMDPVVDKVVAVGMMFVLTDTEHIPLEVGGILLPTYLPTFVVLLVMGREFLITGIRAAAAKRGKVMPADKVGKVKAWAQMIALGAFLFADVAPNHATMLAELGWAVFIIALVLTLYSGWRYCRAYARGS